MLNLFAPVNILGTGIHAYNLAKAYENLGNEICLIPPFGQVQHEDEHVLRWLENQKTFNQKNVGLMIFDIPFMTQFCGSKRIGFAVFETNKLTDYQCAALSSLDLILTPSQWGKEVLLCHSLGVPVEVCHEGYDPEIFHEDSEARSGIIRFVNVGKFEERKGTAQLIKCFVEALEGKEAELLVHMYSPFLNDYTPITKLLSDLNFISFNGQQFLKLGLRIIFTIPTTVHQMAIMLRSSDCGIFPTKGEGWGLPILESIVSNTPAIVGNWTGQSEFLGQDYPKEVTLEKSRCVTANDGIWFKGERGEWFVPDRDELVEKIRWAYDNVRQFKKSEVWLNKCEQMRKDFTWNEAAIRLKEILN